MLAVPNPSISHTCLLVVLFLCSENCSLYVFLCLILLCCAVVVVEEAAVDHEAVNDTPAVAAVAAVQAQPTKKPVLQPHTVNTASSRPIARTKATESAEHLDSGAIKPEML